MAEALKARFINLHETVSVFWSRAGYLLLPLVSNALWSASSSLLFSKRVRKSQQVFDSGITTPSGSSAVRQCVAVRRPGGIGLFFHVANGTAGNSCAFGQRIRGQHSRRFKDMFANVIVVGLAGDFFNHNTPKRMNP